MSVRRHIAVVSTALGTIAAGLLAASTTTAAAQGDGDTAAVDVFVQRNHVIRMDTTLRPGVNKLMIRSARDAGFQLVRADAGYTKRQLGQDIVAGLGRGRMPALRRLERNTTLHGGVGTTADKAGVVWVDLDPGTYWALDTYDETPTAREMRTVRVMGAETSRTMPAGPVIRATGPAEWGPRPARIPARGRMTFRNDSSENHFLIMARFAKGKNMADFKEWVDAGFEGPPPVEEQGGLNTGVISGGEKMAFKYALKPGRYVMVCFWPDASMGGMPHVMMGMYRGIRVG
jgi:hypothetical protein